MIGQPDHPDAAEGRSQAGGPRDLLRRFWPLLLPLVIYLPGVLAFPYPAGDARFSDLVITHLPNLLYLRQALLRWSTLPLWSPLIYSGAPFAANPLAGLWYPPGWLPLLLPVPLGFNLTILLHLIWGGIGLSRLLRATGVGRQAAWFGGMLFVALPKLTAHYGAGHLTLLYAVPWTPWLLLATHQVLARQGSRQRSALFRPAVVLALIFLADVRWAAYAGALWLGWLVHRRNLLASRFPGISRSGAWIAGQLALGAALSACLALPFLEYIGLSTRADLSAADALVFSLPPGRLLGLLFPDFGGFAEWVLYAGGPVLLLAGLGLILPRGRRRRNFWAWVVLLSLLFALGENLPGLDLLAGLPGMSLLRVPPRALFLLGLGLAVLAAHGLQGVLDRPGPVRQRRQGLWIVGFCGFSLAFAGAVVLLTGAWALSFVWGGGMALLAGAWLAFRPRLAAAPRVWLAGLAALCLIDLGVVGLSLYSPRAPAHVWAEDRALAEHLASEQDLFRVYSPSYSLAQQTSASYGLQLADGVDPLQLAGYASYFEAASGVPRTGYSVTLPPLSGEDPTRSNVTASPDPELLGRLNARYVAAEFPVEASNLDFQTRVGSTYLYENRVFRPRAWVQDRPAVAAGWRPAGEIQWSPNVIEMTATGPGLLVLSEISYPGWVVEVDGETAVLSAEAAPLRSVELQPGTHHVRFTFRPWSVGAGLALSVGALILLLVLHRGGVQTGAGEEAPSHALEQVVG